MFESRIEFAHAQFGKPNFSLESGLEDTVLCLPSCALAGKPAVWRWGASAPKVPAGSLAHAGICG
ncbi:MAG: hypothetical protein ACR5LF_08090 [Symbiopectobacterium sp.]